jgi:hypothetical protein
MFHADQLILNLAPDNAAGANVRAIIPNTTTIKG